ncbi:GIY-YIG nuclease family protein [Arenibacter sp. F26102]|uniref:GIY-YIG nuclease family protein n=1 Tax=Arenibacter sp. F26102 TaxID=2926416 RepID=UPI001FF1D431|nr:GIY-YIG nuclease family protein [Arenibacter sp. F26102]
MKDKDSILNQIFENDPFGLLNAKPKKSAARTSDERLTASFDEVNAFIEKNEREPKPDPTNISEYKLYSTLKGLRENENKMMVLEPQDIYGLLKTKKKEINSIDDILGDDSLDILGDDSEGLFKFNHTPKQTSMPSYVARRKKCKNFNDYESLFIQCHLELLEGKRKLKKFKNEQQIDVGYFFVLNGILLYVAHKGKLEPDDKGKMNARLLCIFENGTESDMLMRSLSAELYKNGKRVTANQEKLDKELVQSFGGITAEDEETGHIYVLKSKSEKEDIASIENLYKIGYSSTSVQDRIKNAEKEPTYLMAPVIIESSWMCYNMSAQKFEGLIHQFFGNSCLEVDVFDKKGIRHTPREWFIVPLEAIEQAIALIISGKIIDYRYDRENEAIVKK